MPSETESTSIIDRSHGRKKLTDLGGKIPETTSGSKGAPQKKERKLQLAELPIDIIVHLFRWMHEDRACCTATCLGLTCSSFYPILKTFYPDPINIKDEEVVAWDKLGLRDNAPWETYPFHLPRGVSIYWLGGLLKGFMGPDYRMASCLDKRRPPHPVYLRRSVYGDGITSFRMEKELEERYLDHQMAIDWAKGTLRFGLHDVSSQILLLAPNPFGIGESWYDEVWKEIEKLPHFDEMPLMIWDVEDFWLSTFAYDKFEEQWIWTAYNEWIEMIGF